MRRQQQSFSFVMIRSEIRALRLKTKAPPENPSGALKIPVDLSLAVLEPLARAGLAVFFSFAHTRIASEQSFCFQCRSEVSIDRKQCASQSVSDGTSLAGRPATENGNLRIIFLR